MKKTGECIVDGVSSRKSGFMYLQQVRSYLTDICFRSERGRQKWLITASFTFFVDTPRCVAVCAQRLGDGVALGDA